MPEYYEYTKLPIAIYTIEVRILFLCVECGINSIPHLTQDGLKLLTSTNLAPTDLPLDRKPATVARRC